MGLFCKLAVLWCVVFTVASACTTDGQCTAGQYCNSGGNCATDPCLAKNRDHVPLEPAQSGVGFHLQAVCAVVGSVGFHLTATDVGCNVCKDGFSSDNADRTATCTSSDTVSQCNACSSYNRVDSTCGECGICKTGFQVATTGQLQCEADVCVTKGRGSALVAESVGHHLESMDGAGSGLQLLTGDSYQCGPCDTGKYASDGEATSTGKSTAQTCQSCSSLNRAAGATKTTCGACLTGYVGDATGTTACTLPACNPGYYLSGSTCLACPVNTFSATSGATACEACPAHYNTAGQTTQTSCLSCDAGYTRSGTTCQACAVNTYKPLAGNDACTLCSTPGFTTNGLTAQLACVCAPGYGGDNTQCTACAINFFKPAAGAASCQACGPNKLTRVTASTACDDCPPVVLVPAISGVQSVDVRVSNEVVIRTTLCSLTPDTTMPTFSWTLTSRTPVTAPVISQSLLSSATTSTLLLPAYSLTPDTSYVLTLTASLNGQVADRVSVTVRAQVVPVEARLASLAATNSVGLPLLLDASTSEGGLPGAPLSYTWACAVGSATGAACPGFTPPASSTNPQYTVPANTMTAGTQYFFKVTATRGSESSTATVSTSADASSPSVALTVVPQQAFTNQADGSLTMTINTDSKVTVLLTAISAVAGTFEYKCSLPGLVLSGTSSDLTVTQAGSYTLVINSERKLNFFARPGPYRLSCTASMNSVTSTARVVTLNVRAEPAATFTVTPPAGTVTALTPVTLAVSGASVATVQFFFVSPSSGLEVVLTPVTNTLTTQAYLPAGTTTVKAYVRDAFDSLTIKQQTLAFTVQAVSFDQTIASLDNRTAIEKDGYSRMQLVLAYSAAAAGTINVGQQQQATNRSLALLSQVGPTLTPSDLAVALEQTVTSPGMTAESTALAINLMQGLLSTLLRSDVVSSPATTSAAADTIARLITLLGGQVPTTSSGRMALQAVRRLAVNGFEVQQLNTLFNQSATVMNTLTESAAAAGLSEGQARTVASTSAFLATLSPVNNPTTTSQTVVERSISLAGSTATVSLPVSGGLLSTAPVAQPGYLIGLALGTPNPYSAYVATPVLSAALMFQYQTTTAQRITSVPAGSTVRLTATGTPVAGRMIACGFLNLETSAADFSSYATPTANGGSVYTCPLQSGLGVYSLISVAAPVTPTPTPTPAPVAAQFQGDDYRVRVGVGLGIGVGLSVIIIIILAVAWYYCGWSCCGWDCCGASGRKLVQPYPTLAAPYTFPAAMDTVVMHA